MELLIWIMAYCKAGLVHMARLLMLVLFSWTRGDYFFHILYTCLFEHIFVFSCNQLSEKLTWIMEKLRCRLITLKHEQTSYFSEKSTPVREIIHLLKFVDFLLICANKPWYKYSRLSLSRLVISKNRLSRSEDLVPVLTKKLNNR